MTVFVFQKVGHDSLKEMQRTTYTGDLECCNIGGWGKIGLITQEVKNGYWLSS